MRSEVPFLLAVGLVGFALRAGAAACCGGGVSLPALIQGDERGQVSVQLLRQEMLVDHVDTEGLWRNTGVPAATETLRIEGAWLLSDRTHAGFVLPVVRRTRLDERHAGLGDVAGSLGYEFLPDWDYNPYRPKGVAYLQAVLPTGHGRAESERGGLDSRGQGFAALGAGVVLTKAWGAWDALAGGELHHGFAKDVANAQLQGRLRPGWGGQAQLGGGYNTRAWRFGALATWTHEDPVDLEGPSPRSGRRERYATATLSAGYMAAADWSVTLSYVNQTWLGRPENTSLAAGAGVHLQRRWAR